MTPAALRFTADLHSRCRPVSRTMQALAPSHGRPLPHRRGGGGGGLRNAADSSGLGQTVMCLLSREPDGADRQPEPSAHTRMAVDCRPGCMTSDTNMAAHFPCSSTRRKAPLPRFVSRGNESALRESQNDDDCFFLTAWGVGPGTLGDVLPLTDLTHAICTPQRPEADTPSAHASSRFLWLSAVHSNRIRGEGRQHAAQ